jgi:hypothetical protein
MEEKDAYVKSNSIDYKHFANMTVTVYGNRLPRDTKVKKRRKQLVQTMENAQLLLRKYVCRMQNSIVVLVSSSLASGFMSVTNEESEV